MHFFPGPTEPARMATVSVIVGFLIATGTSPTKESVVLIPSEF